ncbi:MAG: BglI family type II restriction endonuclease, partial [Methylococcaceae bacterium]|nr:BglI family type II restriction endonuclease [Methylococcaceae bacterium]
MNITDYNKARKFLLRDDCKELLTLEEVTTHTLITALLSISKQIKEDFDSATKLRPFWEEYAPVQRGHKPRGEAFPWGEVGEKVVEGYLYSLVPNVFDDVRFIGLPYGHDIRFSTNNAFIHIDAKSTGPTDDQNEVVSSPNQVTGTGKINSKQRVYNDTENMIGPQVTRPFLPELPPFYIIDGNVLPTLTFYLKIVYSVRDLGNQPLEYLELICVPNGLALFDGPKLFQNVSGLLTPGKDEKTVKKVFADAGIVYHVLGEMIPENKLKLHHGGQTFALDIARYRDVWYQTSYLFDQKQTETSAAYLRFENFKRQDLQFQFKRNFSGKIKNIVGNTNRNQSPVAAIIREKGVNGDREMAYALYLAGFRVKDIHMTDLISGREDLSDVGFVVFVGGFSNSDVLGSAKGWAGAFLYNEKAKKALDSFYGREDTLSLGVCNGCQLMMELGLVYPEHPEKPRMLVNSSGKFESGFVNVNIHENNS